MAKPHPPKAETKSTKRTQTAAAFTACLLITSGSQAAFDLLSRILLDPGDTGWMEEPGYPGALDAFWWPGPTCPMAVDQDGWDLSLPARKRPGLIYITPSCQSPFGTTMRMEQRLQLIDIARQNDAWIIEDDYDGGYRVSGLAAPAMQGSDPAGRDGLRWRDAPKDYGPHKTVYNRFNR